MGSLWVSAGLRWSIAGSILLVLAQAGPALADGGLDISSDTTYEIRADEGFVRVEAEYELENTLRNEDDGFYITRYFYKTFTIPIPQTAQNLLATRGTTELTIEIEESAESSFDQAVIKLQSYLYSGQTRTIRFSYDLPSEPVRSDRFVRVNPAFSSFGIWGVGDAGRATVRLLIPDRFSVETVGDEMWYTVGPDGPAWIAEDIAEPGEWYVWVAARDDTRLDTTDLSVGSRSAVIRAWPDDPEWEQFAVDHFTTSVPRMEELIGVPWPIEGRLEIIETATPSLYGAAGWFLTDQNVIEITEQLDSQVMLHELAHAWFSRATFEDRWLSEGLAEELSYRTMEAGGQLRPGGQLPDPSEAFPLNSWERFSSSQTGAPDGRETYGYDASGYVLRQITLEIGMDGLQRVLQAADSGQMAYPGEIESALPRPQSKQTDWRRFLDLTEELGDSDEVAPIFEVYVVTPSQRTQLEQRAEARVAFRALESHGETWTAPIVVRLAMEDWKFSLATGVMADAETVLDLRDAVNREATRQEMVPSSSLKADYESAIHDVHWVIGKGEAQLAAVEAVAEATNAVRADRDTWTALGLWGADIEPDLNHVRATFETGDADATMLGVLAVIAEVDAARSVGLRRAGWGAAGLMFSLGFGLVGNRLLQRRRVRSHTFDEPESTNSRAGLFEHPIFELEVEDFSGCVPRASRDAVGVGVNSSVDPD